MDIPLLIFTDLDGTLLDHHTYSYKGAEEALQRLHQLAIPLVLTSSKTRAELQKLQGILGLAEPFIAENGGGIFLPADYKLLDTSAFETLALYRCRRFGRPYSEILEIFDFFKERYRLKGFSDMTVEEVMAATGLGRDDAILARQRDFSEPFQFMGEPCPEKLKEEVAQHGLTVTRGGRFYHLMASGQDKGRAVTATRDLFQAECTGKITAIALGDAENDIAMLKVADIPVLIPKPDGSYEITDIPGLRKAHFPGSAGWGKAITGILNDFQLFYSEKELQG